jgi:hypothetical protein
MQESVIDAQLLELHKMLKQFDDNDCTCLEDES